MERRLARIGLAVCMALLGACSTQTPLAPIDAHILKTPFDAQFASSQMQPGSSRVDGQASARAPNGTMVSCAGAPAVLVPVTEYATERFNAIYGSAPGQGQVRRLAGKVAAEKPTQFYPDLPEYKTFSRDTLCDASGRFEFLDVKRGLYYLFTMVVWQESPFDGMLYATQLNVHDDGRVPVVFGEYD